MYTHRALFLAIQRQYIRGVVQLVERRSPKPHVVGSNPATPARFFIFMIVMVGVAKWLTHRIVAPALVGSNPIAHPIVGESPSGKATDFDSVIRRFDPYLPSHFEPLAQLVEHLTFNQGVAGSSPAWLTTYKPRCVRKNRMVDWKQSSIRFFVCVRIVCVCAGVGLAGPHLQDVWKHLGQGVYGDLLHVGQQVRVHIQRHIH